MFKFKIVDQLSFSSKKPQITTAIIRGYGSFFVAIWRSCYEKPRFSNCSSTIVDSKTVAKWYDFATKDNVSICYRFDTIVSWQFCYEVAPIIFSGKLPRICYNYIVANCNETYTIYFASFVLLCYNLSSVFRE